MRLGDLDPCPDDKLPGIKAAQPLDFLIPGFNLQEARLGLIGTHIPVFTETDLWNAQSDRLAAHGFGR